jgi:cell division protein FtsB
MATTQRSTRRAARRRAPADLLLGVLLLATLALGVLVLAPPFEDYRAARQRVALLEQQAAALEVENERLASRVEDLDDPVTLELLARQQQGLVRPGDVPYVLTPPEVDAPRIVDVQPVPQVAEDDVLDRVLAWIRALTR